MSSKEVIIFPYININKIIKMDDFEIHPLEKYNLKKELNNGDIGILNEFTNSFRKSIFHKGNSPEKAEGIGILKYKGTILRTNENSIDISDKIKIIFLLLKLHISHDFFNSWMGDLNVKCFDYFNYNLSNTNTGKFGVGGDCKKLYSTIPENVKGLKEITFIPLVKSFNKIPVTFSLIGGSEEILGINKECIDLSYLYNGIKYNQDYHNIFINLSSIHYGLEQQNDLFFYYSIIPSIIEVLLINIKGNKKEKAINYGIELDNSLIKENDYIEQIVYRKGQPIKENLGLIARTLILIYDMRNDLLHEGKKSFDKMKINFKGYDSDIYSLFKIIFKYSIINDFINNSIIKNEFLKLKFEGDALITGNVKIYQTIDTLHMDDELNGLLEKAKSDKELKQGLYRE